MRKILYGTVTAALAVSSCAAFAQTAQDPNSGSGTHEKNAKLDQMVCETQEDTGSRLTGKKICMTRGEFQQRRLAERQTIEKSQTEQGIAIPGK